MSKPTESEASILFRICGQKDAEIERLRAALAAAEAKMETIEATATANARDYWQAALADERKHADALDAALRDPDSITVERARAAHAARRAAEVGNA